MAVTWHLTLRFGDEIYKEGDCLSTDTKPVSDTTLMNGSKLTEIDTADIYRFDKENTQWLQCGSESGGGSGGGVEFHICTSGEYNATTGVPTVSNPDPKTFYLVPDGSGNDLFIEWIYVNNAWEKFGSARIDLSGYITGVTVNGTSVVTNGVADIPIATSESLGVVKVDRAYGVTISNGALFVSKASGNEIKNNNNNYAVITTDNLEAATFYGLAKAAGDTTQRALDYAVGTYTDTAKQKIQAMLGVGVTRTLVTGSTPAIIAEPNTLYICGEVSTLSITPPASGIFSVIFESGSTPTVLTLGAGIITPGWFELDNLDSNTIYELNIQDGYLTVGQWGVVS